MTTNSTASFNSDRTKCNYQYHDVVWRRKYFTENMFKNLVAVASINSVAVVPTVFLNALVIFAVATRRPLRSNTNVLLACMALTDFLSGMIVQPLNVAVEVKNILGVGPFCALEKVYAVALAGISFASIDHLVLISIERYIAIKYSLRYQDIVTKQWLKIGVSLAWTWAVLVTIQEIVLTVVDTPTKLAYLQLVTATFSVIGLTFIIVICYTNVYICLQTRRHKKRIQTEQVSYEEAKKVKKDNRAANTLAIILGTLILTNVPSLFLMVTSFSDSTMEPNPRNILWKWAVTFSLLKSLLNPIIYCWRVKKLRRAFLEILHLRQQENSPPEMREMQRNRGKIQTPISEAASMPVRAERQNPVFVSSCHLQAEEIFRIEETDK